ncbi:hypothetical protein [Clostridium sp. BL-8]|nr:hypothetical protein [Clostridium sp. BL-8]OOM69017.1 hypothetical protein CLOBL_52840 [Clostridium sp. BL-8]
MNKKNDKKTLKHKISSALTVICIIFLFLEYSGLLKYIENLF